MELLDFRFSYRYYTILDESGEGLREIGLPMLPCTLISDNNKERTADGLLDSGSDGVVIPMRMAKMLGLKLEGADPISVVGARTARYKSKVSIMLGRGGRICGPIADVDVSVIENDESPMILGRNPIFRLYRITFIEAEQRFEMIPYRPVR
jgi:hypothetical protein